MKWKAAALNLNKKDYYALSMKLCRLMYILHFKSKTISKYLK